MNSAVLQGQTEIERVQAWRLHVLIEAGFPLKLAEEIAGSNADLHEAIDLVSAGCSYKTAARILL